MLSAPEGRNQRTSRAIGHEALVPALARSHEEGGFAVVSPDELDEHALAMGEPWPRLTRLTAPAAPNKSTALTAEEGAIGSCALPSVKPSGLCLWRRTSRQ